jgi:GntR family transcriptional repressor for pyruvate dehydrogenase complex
VPRRWPLTFNVSIPPPLAPVKAPQAHVAVADALRRRIALGAYVPGERLPSERDLSETLGVGRMTLRAAIRLLHDEGLLSTTKGRSGGTWVLDDAAPRTGSRRGQLIRRYADDIHKNYEFRLAVEPVAAALCAERATQEQRDEILLLSQDVAQNVRTFRVHDSRFHLTIVEYCGNALFLEPVRNSRAEFFIWADGLWTQREWDRLHDTERDFELAHRPIAEAIHVGDADAAASRTREHLLEGAGSYEKLLTQ